MNNFLTTSFVIIIIYQSIAWFRSSKTTQSSRIILWPYPMTAYSSIYSRLRRKLTACDFISEPSAAIREFWYTLHDINDLLAYSTKQPSDGWKIFDVRWIIQILEIASAHHAPPFCIRIYATNQCKVMNFKRSGQNRHLFFFKTKIKSYIL